MRFADHLAVRCADSVRRAWVLTTEDVTDPPKRLVEECKKIGIEDGAFTVCDIGETMVV